MREYVVGFAFADNFSSVWLIQKNRPDWQKGKLNGVGGKIELGESAYEAMVREFYEETGSVAPRWYNFATHRGFDWSVEAFWSYVPLSHDSPRTTTDEEVKLYDLRSLFNDSYELVPRVKSLVAMALDHKDLNKIVHFIVEFSKEW